MPRYKVNLYPGTWDLDPDVLKILSNEDLEDMRQAVEVETDGTAEAMQVLLTKMSEAHESAFADADVITEEGAEDANR